MPITLKKLDKVFNTFKNEQVQVKYDVSLIQRGSQFSFKFLENHSKIDLIVSYSGQLIYRLMKDSNNTFSCDLIDILSKLDELDIKSNKIIFKIDDAYISIRHQKLQISGFENIKYGEHNIAPYITKNGFVALAIDTHINKKTYIKQRTITSLESINDSLILTGRVTTLYSKIDSLFINVYSRKSPKTRLIPTKISLRNESSKLMEYRYNFKAVIPKKVFKSIVQTDSHPLSIVDFDLFINLHGLKEKKVIRLGNPRARTKIHATRGIFNIFVNKNKTLEFTPYYTFKGNNLAYRVVTFNYDAFQEYKRILSGKEKRKSGKNIWLIGEKEDKAQDNGLHFFRYLRKYHPEINSYYVIAKEYLKLDTLKDLDNVISFGSKEHIEIAYQATVICSTHDYKALMPTLNTDFLKKIKAKKIFLQHGVLGTKNLIKINGRYGDIFKTDLFITSSSRERDIVVNQLGFNQKNVAVTGLARFDALFKNVPLPKKQILIIPTWRDYLKDITMFKNSDYKNAITRLLNDKYILNLHNSGFEIVFCMHPNAQEFINLINIPPFVKTIYMGDISVQTLIRESALMITDYSSVGIDFAALKKPVIYYQYDQLRFLGKDGSHFNLEDDLPGEVVYTKKQLIDTLDAQIKNNFNISDQVKKNIKSLIGVPHYNNCDRIFNAILVSQKENIYSKIVNSFIFSKLINHLRKNSYYFQVQKNIFRFMRMFLPTSKNKIVFESGLGKQFSDNPKQIYLHLISRDDANKYQFIWIYKGYDIPKTANLKIVKRFSFGYYYHLATAQYWINNQNFPKYLKKPKNTIFLQTWHGTPLKRMLNDVKRLTQEQPKHIREMNKVNSKWDYLISPSPYATTAFKSAFKPQAEILETGYPRNDIFFINEEKKQTLKVKLTNLWHTNGKKIILYMPTFRDDERDINNRQAFFLHLDLESMFNALNDEYVVLFRQHAIVKTKVYIPDYFSDFFIDVSDYSDVQELYTIADICITDYSSVMFDFSITRRPILFYVYDYYRYKDIMRGFYINFEEEAPGPLIFNTKQLISSIIHIEHVNNKYTHKYEDFYNKYNQLETGHATERVVKKVFQKNSK